MYVSPYVVGGGVVLIVEFLLIVGYGIYKSWQEKNRRH